MDRNVLICFQKDFQIAFRLGWAREIPARVVSHRDCQFCNKYSYSEYFSHKMESIYRIPFTILEVPNLKLKKPSWFTKPSAMIVFSFILLSYFLVTGGIIYNVIVEPPSVGSTTDEHGHTRPVAFMSYRVNGQYIMEGLASSFLFTLGGLGFIVLDQTHSPSTPKLNRVLLISVGFISILVSFATCWIFMRMKLPGYLQL